MKILIITSSGNEVTITAQKAVNSNIFFEEINKSLLTGGNSRTTLDQVRAY